MRSLRLGLPAALCFALLMLLEGAGPASAQGRHALLIGNADYAGSRLDLANPVNDVLALGVALEALGFETRIVTDRNAADMADEIARFGAAAEGAEMALFFFAGHGLQLGGENLLVGSGFDGSGAQALLARSVPLRRVIDTLASAGAKASLVVLDACRDTPFEGGVALRPGLVRENGGAGLLLAYATDPGNVAYDGAGRNSVFTTALLDHVATPGLDVRLMLGRVRQQVVIETFGRQVPWVEEALIGEHLLVPDAPTPPVADPFAGELRAWRAALAAGSAEALDAFLEAYPAGSFAGAARARLASLRSADVAGRASIPPGADPEDLALALRLAGFGEAEGPDALADALGRFRAAFPEVPETATAPIYREALRAAVGQAATTARQLRTDLVALRSIDRLLRVSRGALSEMEALAADRPEAEPLVAEARRDLDAIETARLGVLVRLDEARTFYDTLIQGVAAILPRIPDPSVAAASGDDDARLFLDHVARADPATKGSYAWLADFLAGG